MKKEKIIVGISGASGAAYAVRLVEILLKNGFEIELCVTENSRLIIKDELGVSIDEKRKKESLKKLWGKKGAGKIRWNDINDLAAPISSGSYRTKGMAVVPCSMATLSAVACGASRNLLQRAADVMLKEGRPLVLVPRETPLSAIHLENMLRLSRAGAAIVPAMPAFYHKPKKISDLVDFVVTKILDRLDIESDVIKRWK